MALYHINSQYYRQFLTTTVKADKGVKGKGNQGSTQKTTEKRSMQRDDWPWKIKLSFNERDG